MGNKGDVRMAHEEYEKPELIELGKVSAETLASSITGMKKVKKVK